MPRTKKQFAEMREATNRKIIAAASRLFAERGLAATSVQDIAAAAGISMGLMYRHYESKETLYLHLIGRTAKIQGRMIELLRFEASPKDIIRLLAEEIRADIVAGGDAFNYMALMLQSQLAKESPEVRNLLKTDMDVVAALADLIRSGQAKGLFKEGDPEELGWMFYANVQGMTALRFVLKDDFRVPSVETMVSFLIKSA